jgi:diacylglycerol kinase (ATP)
MNKYCFIVNPKSGSGKALPALLKALQSSLRKDDYTILETQYAKHAGKLAQYAMDEGATRIIVAGGDGTMNEVAGVLAKTKTELALIPSGSGNGLARHCGIPLQAKNALNLALNGTSQPIDTVLINNNRCVNVAGIGFDAMIAKRFNNLKKRGHWAYVRTIMSAYPRYQPKKYRIKTDTIEFETEALFIGIANSSQFGNNATIAPQASICDGLADLCIFSKIPLLHIPASLFKLYHKRIDHSSFVNIIRIKNAMIECKESDFLHIDGEPTTISGKTEIAVDKASLHLVTPKTHPL